jgi:hypothetical protein
MCVSLCSPNLADAQFIDFTYTGVDFRGRIIYRCDTNKFQFYTGGSVSAELNTTAMYSNDFLSLSDKSIKKNIEDIDVKDCYKLLDNVKAKTYMRSDKTGDAAGETHIGFIAQDVEKVVKNTKFKNLVSEIEWNEKDILTLNYTKMVPILFSIIKDLSERVKELEKRI